MPEAKTSRSLWGAFVCFMLYVGIIAWFWSYQYPRERKAFYDAEVEQLATSYQIINDSYKRSASIIFDDIISMPGILPLYQQANSPDEHIKNKVREQLFNRLNPLYQRLKKRNIRQLHFHLPNCDSFLRFHKPSKNGDNLKDVRYSLVKANTELVEVVGFEEGRVKNGFRYVFPLLYQNQHLGSVEVSLSFDAIKQELEKIFHHEYTFLLNKEVVNTKVFQSEQSFYKSSEISPGFVTEVTAENSAVVGAIDAILKPEIQEQLKNSAGFARSVKVEGLQYLVAFYPVKNVKGDHVAWIVSYGRDTYSATLIFTFLIRTILSVLVLAFVFLFFLIIAAKNKKLDAGLRKQQKTIVRLRETEENFNRVFYNAQDAVLLIRDDIFIDCNEATVTMLGAVDKQQVINAHPSELSPEKQPDGQPSFEKANEMINRALSNGFHRFEWEHRKINGECFPVEVSLTIIYQKGQTVLHVLWKDLTERKEYEDGLLKATTAALASSEAKMNFLANMSHDIRTPMNGIIGMTRLALDTSLDSSQQKLLKNILSSADNLLGLLNDILDFSKIEAGQLTLEEHDFSLESMLDNLISSMSYMAAEKQISLDDHTDYTQLPAYIRSDKMRLRQVLTNLMGNALKFTEDGGVAVKVRAGELSQERIVLVFSVADTGIGISPKQQKNIFDSFVQAEDSITRKFGGTGLGLSISRQLVEMMGGNIWLESRVGFGTVFHFEVEVARGDKQAFDEDFSHPETHYDNLSILLVEDNAINQELATMVLERDGHRVTVAENGRAALQKMAESDFDVVLMDVQMPEMDGMTATLIIRGCENGRTPQESEGVDKTLMDNLAKRIAGGYTPIIAMTANAMSEDKKRCLAAGMDGYLTKPFMPEHLFQALNDLFTARH